MTAPDIGIKKAALRPPQSPMLANASRRGHGASATNRSGGRDTCLRPPQRAGRESRERFQPWRAHYTSRARCARARAKFFRIVAESSQPQTEDALRRQGCRIWLLPRSRRRNSLLAIAWPSAESLGASHRVPACRLVGSVGGGQSQPANRDGRAQMTLKVERFQPEGMNVRISNGQPSYSHVVTVSGAGKIVYTAGQRARDIDGNCVGKGDMRAQMEQTFL